MNDESDYSAEMPELGIHTGSGFRSDCGGGEFKGEVALCVKFRDRRGIADTKCCEYELFIERVWPEDALMSKVGRSWPNFYVNQFALVKGAYYSNNWQMSMPIELCAVVDDCDGIADRSLIRCAERFVCIARLYRLQPERQFVRQWNFVECSIFEVSFFREDRKIKVFCVGGVLGSAEVGVCLPNEAIQGRAELIKELAEYELRFMGKGLSGKSLNDPLPVILHLMDDGMGILTHIDFAQVYEGFRVAMRPVDSVPPFPKE